MTRDPLQSMRQPARHEERTALLESTARTRSGLRLGSLFHVDLVLDWSLLIIFAIISVDLGMRLFPSWHPEWSPGLSWAVALGAALLFLISVLLHELAHAVVARARGVPVRRITLFLFGGLAHMDRDPDTPRSEFLIAIAGPITSLLIGMGALAMASSLSGVDLEAATSTGDPEAVMSALSKVPPVASLLLWLGPINLMLALFNLVPGFPLDGGRVLRSLLWAVTKDLTRATRWASGAGQAIAWALMAFGAFNVFSGAVGSGLWLVLIGWFLNNAAKLSYQQLLLHDSLREVCVADVMNTRITRLAPELLVSELVRDHVLSGEQRVFPIQADGRLLGLIGLRDVRKLAPSEWSSALVQDVMSPTADTPGLRPDESAEHALKQLAAGSVEQLPVMQDSQVIGLVGQAELMRWLGWRRDLARSHA